MSSEHLTGFTWGSRKTEKESGAYQVTSLFATVMGFTFFLQKKRLQSVKKFAAEFIFS